MKISTKGRYGLRMVVDLAIAYNAGPLTVKNLAQREEISGNYLENIFSALRKAGIIKSIKGPQGGYILARIPSSITAAEVIRALEGDISLIDGNIFSNNCTGSMMLFLKDHLWDKIDKSVNDAAESITIEELVEEYKKNNEKSLLMYYI